MNEVLSTKPVKSLNDLRDIMPYFVEIKSMC